MGRSLIVGMQIQTGFCAKTAGLVADVTRNPVELAVSTADA